MLVGYGGLDLDFRFSIFLLDILITLGKLYISTAFASWRLKHFIPYSLDGV